MRPSLANQIGELQWGLAIEPEEDTAPMVKCITSARSGWSEDLSSEHSDGRTESRSLLPYVNENKPKVRWDLSPYRSCNQAPGPFTNLNILGPELIQMRVTSILMRTKISLSGCSDYSD